MSLETTISTQFGHTAHREHNIRDERVVEKQSHINPHGEYEIWLDKDPKEAYHELFDKAQEEYNDKQKREDRKIPDYYEKVKADKTLHPVYETITQIGDKNCPIPPQEQKEILREYADGWKEANPNMIMIGCYFHNDEKGGMHLHTDFIPVAHGYTRGMETQTSLTRAIKEQDNIRPIKKEGEKVLTPQTQWQRKENDRLQEIVERRGYRVIHPERDKSPEQKREHEHSKIYGERKDLERDKEAFRQEQNRQFDRAMEQDRKQRALNRQEKQNAQEKAQNERTAKELEERAKAQEKQTAQAKAIIERDERAKAIAKNPQEIKIGAFNRVNPSDIEQFNRDFRDMARMANSEHERAELMKGQRDQAMRNENLRKDDYISHLEKELKKAERDHKMMDFLREKNPYQARTIEQQYTRHEEKEREKAERDQSRSLEDKIKQAEERQREEQTHSREEKDIEMPGR